MCIEAQERFIPQALLPKYFRAALLAVNVDIDDEPAAMMAIGGGVSNGA